MGRIKEALAPRPRMTAARPEVRGEVEPGLYQARFHPPRAETGTHPSQGYAESSSRTILAPR